MASLKELRDAKDAALQRRRAAFERHLADDTGRVVIPYIPAASVVTPVKHADYSTGWCW